MLLWSHEVAGKACSTLELTWKKMLNQYTGSLHGLAAHDWPMLMPAFTSIHMHNSMKHMLRRRQHATNESKQE